MMSAIEMRKLVEEYETKKAEQKRQKVLELCEEIIKQIKENAMYGFTDIIIESLPTDVFEDVKKEFDENGYVTKDISTTINALEIRW